MWNKLVVLVLFIVSLNSCRLGSLDDPILIANIDQEFELQLWELLLENERKLVIRVNSIEDEDCLNAKIATNFIVRPRNVELSIDDIIIPSDCIEGKAPAAAEIDGSGIQIGLYNLKVDLKNTIINEGQLIIAEDSYQISLFSSKGLQLPKSTLRSMPDSLIWGYIQFQPDSQSLAEELRVQIEQNNQSPPLQPGNYGYFFKNDDSDISVNGQPTTNVIPFVLKQQQSNLELEAMTQEIRSRLGNQGTFELMNAEGKTF